MSSTRVGFCAAFQAGYEALLFALEGSHSVDFVATSASDTSCFEEKIAILCQSRGITLQRRVDANSATFRNFLISRKPDLVFLAWWPSIVKKESIALVRVGWVNMHPSLLPYNRGKHPYYWAVVEGTPFGVTLHFIDEGVDTGDVLFQKEIVVDPSDTGESLYRRGLTECLSLFRESYDRIVNLDFKAKPQDASVATFHLKKQIEDHSQIDLDRTYLGRELIDILRARSFSHGDSAYFIQDGKKYQLRLCIEPVEAQDKTFPEKKKAA